MPWIVGVGFGLSGTSSFAQLKIDESEPAVSPLLTDESASPASPTRSDTVFYIPEPSTYGLAGVAFLGVLLAARRIGVRSTALAR